MCVLVCVCARTSSRYPHASVNVSLCSQERNCTAGLY